MVCLLYLIKASCTAEYMLYSWLYVTSELGFKYHVDGRKELYNLINLDLFS